MSTCEVFQAALEEKLCDDTAIDPQLEAHATECPECQTLVATLEQLQAEVVLDEVARRDVDSALQIRGIRRTRRRIALAAGFLIIALGGWLATRLATETPAGLLIAGGSLMADGEVLHAGVPLPNGSLLVGDAGAEITLDAGRARLGAKTRLRAKQSTRELAVRLDEGTLAAELTPRKDRQALTIITPDLIARIVGTRFVVEVVAGETRVDVLRGVVQVQAGEMTTLVTAGQSFSRRELIPTPNSRAREAVAFLDQGVPIPDDTIEHEPAESPTKAARPHVKPADLLQRATRCQKQRDWQCAAKLYRKITAGSHGHPALVSLAQIELEHLGQAAAARKHFSTYVAQNPKGALVPEALDGLARAHRELGNNTAEEETLEKLVTIYPASRLVPVARQRLKELQQ